VNRFTPLFDLILVTSVVLASAYLLGVFGPALDERDSASAIDAQSQAQREYRRELAEAKMCREMHGESLVRHTADGETVCVPRGYIRHKSQLASNP